MHAIVQVAQAAAPDRPAPFADPIRLADEAWWAGYTLGLDYEDGCPPGHYGGHQRNAWLDGLDKGRAEVEAEINDWCDANQPDWHEAEVAACYGHRIPS